MLSGTTETTHIAAPSVQSLLLESRFNGKCLSTATGFIVKHKSIALLVTNRHVVTGRHNETDVVLSKMGGIPNEIAIFHNRKNSLGEWLWRDEPLFDAQRPRWIEHPLLGSKMDCVVLPLSNLDDVALYPYSLDEPTQKIKLGPAESISVVGFPFGLLSGGGFAIWATGFIASELGVDHGALPQFLIDCRGRSGQSGSPVIAYRAGGMTPLEQELTFATSPLTQLLGIYSGRINAESDLGIVWKISALRDLVQSVNI